MRDLGIGLYYRRDGEDMDVPELLAAESVADRGPAGRFAIGGATVTDLSAMLVVDDVVDAVAEHLCLAGAAALRRGEGVEYAYRTTPETFRIAIEGEEAVFRADNGRSLRAPLADAIAALAEAGASWVALMRRLGPAAPLAPGELARLEAAEAAATGGG